MMRITYEKLRILMVKERYEWKDLKVLFGFSSHTIVKLKEDQIVKLEILLRICDYFKCNLSDIAEGIYYNEHDIKL